MWLGDTSKESLGGDWDSISVVEAGDKVLYGLESTESIGLLVFVELSFLVKSVCFSSSVKDVSVL